jgi:transcriptional regulator with XRE-family HTH domain
MSKTRDPKDARPLTAEQLADARRLHEAFVAAKARDPSITQEWLAERMDDLTQAGISHFMTGRRALPLARLLQFSALLGVPPSAISPSMCAPYVSTLLQPTAAEPVASYDALTEAERTLIEYIRQRGETLEHRDRIARTAFWLLRAMVENAVPDDAPYPDDRTAPLPSHA